MQHSATVTDCRPNRVTPQNRSSTLAHVATAERPADKSPAKAASESLQCRPKSILQQRPSTSQKRARVGHGSCHCRPVKEGVAQGRMLGRCAAPKRLTAVVGKSMACTGQEGTTLWLWPSCCRLTAVPSDRAAWGRHNALAGE